MRSIMNGTLAFSLVSVPIKLYSAAEDHDLESHLVHTHDHGKIAYRKVCTACDQTVEARDIAKQYTVDDQTVILTDDDLSQIDAGKNREISILEFVPAGSIPAEAYDRPYYAGPADNAAMKAYALLADTLTSTDRVAIVKYTLRSKTRLAVLSVTGKGVLMVQSLRWPDEIRPPVLPALDTAVLDRRREELTDAEKSMAKQLVDSMAAEWNPDKYHDSYKVELRELVLSKVGETVDEVPDDVSDLLAKLEASTGRSTAKPNVCKQDVRSWARSQGIRIGDRGRIPRDIVDRFEKATA